MEKKTIAVLGMMCASCAANVEKKLNLLEGISHASVNLPGRTVLVEFDPARITLQQMKDALGGIGYDMIIEEDRNVEAIERRTYQQLRRKVQALTGKTPAAYFLQIRLSNAKRMLDGHPEMSVSDVAYRCGFSDLPHFSHAFKEAYGLSPSQWMKRAH